MNKCDDNEENLHNGTTGKILQRSFETQEVGEEITRKRDNSLSGGSSYGAVTTQGNYKMCLLTTQKNMINLPFFSTNPNFLCTCAYVNFSMVSFMEKAEI